MKMMMMMIFLLKLDSHQEVEWEDKVDKHKEAKVDKPKEVKVDKPKEAKVDKPKEVKEDKLKEVKPKEVKGAGIAVHHYARHIRGNVQVAIPVAAPRTIEYRLVSGPGHGCTTGPPGAGRPVEGIVPCPGHGAHPIPLGQCPACKEKKKKR